VRIETERVGLLQPVVLRPLFSAAIAPEASSQEMPWIDFSEADSAQR
jgi:hypothetical protein